MYYIVGTKSRELLVDAYPIERNALLAFDAYRKRGAQVVGFYLDREPTDREIRLALRGVPPKGARERAGGRVLVVDDVE